MEYLKSLITIRRNFEIENGSKQFIFLEKCEKFVVDMHFRLACEPLLERSRSWYENLQIEEDLSELPLVNVLVQHSEKRVKEIKTFLVENLKFEQLVQENLLYIEERCIQIA